MDVLIEQFVEYLASGSAVALTLAYLGLLGLVNQFVKSVVGDEEDRVRFCGFLESRKWWDFYAFAVSKLLVPLNKFFGTEIFSYKAFSRNLGIAIAYPWFLIAFSIWLDPLRPLSDLQRNFMLAGALLIFPVSFFLYRRFAFIENRPTELMAGFYGFCASIVFLVTVVLVGIDDIEKVKQCASGSTNGIELVQHAANSHFDCLSLLPAHDFFFITAVPAVAISLNSILISNGGLSSFVGGVLGLMATCLIAFPEIVLPVFTGIFLISYGIPLLNGVLDFFSMMITRHLLKSLEADAKQQNWLGAFRHVLIDILAALVVLSVLSLTLWTVLNLNGQFPDIVLEWLGHSTAPWSPAAFPWSMMFLTILIPTGICSRTTRVGDDSQFDLLNVRCRNTVN